MRDRDAKHHQEFRQAPKSGSPTGSAPTNAHSTPNRTNHALGGRISIRRRGHSWHHPNPKAASPPCRSAPCARPRCQAPPRIPASPQTPVADRSAPTRACATPQTPQPRCCRADLDPPPRHRPAPDPRVGAHPVRDRDGKHHQEFRQAHKPRSPTGSAPTNAQRAANTPTTPLEGGSRSATATRAGMNAIHPASRANPLLC